MKYVYLFTEGNASMRELLGGKGANLAEMTHIGLPVPQGFTITTEACTKYYDDGKEINDEIKGQINEYITKLEEITGKKFGDKENPLLDIEPRTFIFGAKAASGYRRAKSIIKLINTLAERINNDADINGKIKVVFLENYRVSLAEKIFPAADISEQISTASKEASGTGNMKFMLNGALTLGTMDGANVEIVEEAGLENEFIFGLSAAEVEEFQRNGQYNPFDDYNKVEGLKKVVDQLGDGTFDDDHKGIFRELQTSLLYGVDGSRPDVYFLLRDFDSYREAQTRIDNAYKNKRDWARKALINIANAGKFSSDRTIMEYAREIWNIEPTEVIDFIED